MQVQKRQGNCKHNFYLPFLTPLMHGTKAKKEITTATKMLCLILLLASLLKCDFCLRSRINDISLKCAVCFLCCCSFLARWHLVFPFFVSCTYTFSYFYCCVSEFLLFFFSCALFSKKLQFFREREKKKEPSLFV